MQQLNIERSTKHSVKLKSRQMLLPGDIQQLILVYFHWELNIMGIEH